MTKILKIFITFMLAMFIGIVNVFAYEVGDIIEFGSYPYEADGTEKPIEWLILEKYTDGTALVISKYALDNVEYNETYTSVTWETSSIRKWLNNDFYNKAFKDADKSLIVQSYLENKDNIVTFLGEKYHTKGGKNTYDMLFLLSIDEAKKYFSSDEKMRLLPTPYAKGSKSKNGKLWTNAGYGGSCCWWLRSPGLIQNCAALVLYSGSVHFLGNSVNLVSNAVRVAFKINLNNLKSSQTDGGSPAATNGGDIIEFGSYPYEADGTEKPIEWQILEKYADGTALVISKYALDNVKYNETRTDVTWETSTIRRWLNNDFYNKAFRNANKSLIVQSYLENKDIFAWNAKGGNNTNDKMFLLSIDEAKKYFGSDNARKALPTPYAKAVNNGRLHTNADYGGSCRWWLRSPSHISEYCAAGVFSDGGVDSHGGGVYVDTYAVRVAFKINLKNLKSAQTDGGSPAATNGGGKTQVLSAAGSKFSKPPRLSVANISFTDDANTKVLMADGKGNISFTVSNSQAGGTAYNLKALISAKDLSGKALQNVSFPAAKEIGNISPGKSVKVVIPITGGDNLASGTAAFTISFAEANGFEPEAKTIKIQTVKLDPPDIQLAEFGLDDTEGELSFGNGNGIVEPGESIVLNLALLNDGNGATKGTKITFESGDQNIFFIDNTQFSKGNIQPGAKTNIKTAFSINRRYKGNEVLPITMKITDERKRFSKTIPLNIALKRSYPKTEVITVAGNYKKPQKIKAQADGIKNIPDAKTQNRYGVAVIIGVRNYENKVPPVLFALNDAQTMRDYAVKALGYSPDNIIYVQDPTKGQMEEIFGTDKTHKGKLFNYLKPGKSDVFIYYAGHGAPDQDTRAAYFVPKDANPDYIKIGGYAMETLYTNLAKLPARKITVVTDACFSGQTGEGKMIIKNASPLAVSAKMPGGNTKINVFNASRDREMASWYTEKQHSLFTYYFLLGLSGEADSNKDKTITAGEMSDYLQENVPGIARRLYNREQNPVFSGNINAPIAEYK